MERIAPAGDVYQAGTLSGNPLAVAAGLATLSLLDEEAYLRLAATTRALAEGLREAAASGRRRRRRSSSATGLLTVFFSAEPVQRLRGRRRLRPRGPRRLVPGAARARRLPAAVAVRGLVPVARAHRRARRPHARGRGGRVRGESRERRSTGSSSDACASAAACWPRPSADGAGRRPRPTPHGDAGGRRAAGRGGARPSYALLVEAIREGYLLHYGDGRVRRARTTPTSRCSPATGSTRSAWRGWPSSATSRRSPSSPT